MGNSPKINPRDPSANTINHSTGAKAVTLKILTKSGIWNSKGIIRARPKTTTTRGLLPNGPVERNVLVKDLQLKAKKISKKTKVDFDLNIGQACRHTRSKSPLCCEFVLESTKRRTQDIYVIQPISGYQVITANLSAKSCGE